MHAGKADPEFKGDLKVRKYDLISLFFHSRPTLNNASQNVSIINLASICLLSLLCILLGVQFC